MNILFLCTGNSCRSILAEAIFNQLAPDGWHAMSAGSHPTGIVNKYALNILTQKGINITGFTSKYWDNLPFTPDIVITVCSAAANEPCPFYSGTATRAHWGLADPADATGTEEEILKVFESTYDQLFNGIYSFLHMPLDEMQKDPELLKKNLDFIEESFFE